MAYWIYPSCSASGTDDITFYTGNSSGTGIPNIKVRSNKENLEKLIYKTYKQLGIKNWNCWLNKRTKLWYARIESNVDDLEQIKKIALKLGFTIGGVDIKGNKVKCPCKKEKVEE